MSRRRRTETFGQTLRRVREKADVGLNQLARDVGIHPTYLSKIELGQLPPPDWKKIADIAHRLDCPEMVNAAQVALHAETKKWIADLLHVAPSQIPELTKEDFRAYTKDLYKRTLSTNPKEMALSILEMQQQILLVHKPILK